MHTHKILTLKFFFLEFQSCLCNTKFLPLVPSDYKTHHIYTSYHVQTSVQVSLVCWLFFFCPFRKIIGYWSQAILSQTQSYWKKYSNYYQSCCVHMAIKLKHKTCGWYSTQMWKISNSFLKKKLQTVWKFQNKKMLQPRNIVRFMFYIKNKYSQVCFFTNHWLTTLPFWCLF